MQQIFISYARDDDEPPPGEADAKGFVTYLHDQLRYELTQLGQPRPELWRDRQRIERSNQFEPHLSEALARSSLLLVVLSRNWMDRDWCRRELEEFAKRFSNEDERKVRERIIVVGKNDVDITARPKWIQGQESYNLFWTDPESRKEVDFFVRGRIVDPRYLYVLRDLALYIHKWSQEKAASASRVFQKPILEALDTLNRAQQPVVSMRQVPEAPRQRIFLAHAREDKQRVRELYARLKDAGFNPWLDEVDLLPGQNWKVEIQSAIRSAGVFLACLSSHSVAKQGYVQTEFKTALTAYSERPAGAIYIIPVKLDECEVPDIQIPSQATALRDIHWVELWEEIGIQQLTKAIKHALATTAS